MKLIRSAIGSTAALGILKFLREKGFYLIGTDITDLSVGKFLTDEFYLVPKAKQEQAVVAKYAEIAAQTAAAWILSGPETEIEVLLKHKDALPCGVFHLPYETFSIITDKAKLYSFLHERNADVQCAPTRVLASVQESDYSNEQRIVLKPAQGRGSAGVVFTTAAELSYYQQRFQDIDYVVQPFLAGVEYTVDTLHDFEGRLLNAIPRIRLSTESGISTVSKTVREEELINAVEKLSAMLPFAGPNCIQFIKSEGKYYLTDINPRLGGGSILSLNASDSFASNLVALLKGQQDQLTVNAVDFRELTMMRGYEEYYQ